MKKIAIIGAGIGGVSILKALDKLNLLSETVLINPKDYVEVPFAILRDLVDSSALPNVPRKKINDMFTVDFIMGKVAELKEKSLILEDGQRVEFEYAVVATGSAIRGFDNLKISHIQSIVERTKEIKYENNKIEKANSILIIGGGPIGVELAGEIAFKYQDKKITLVNGPDKLLAALPSGAGKKAEKVLSNMGVQVENNVYLEPIEGSENAYVSKTGEKYEADVVFKGLGNILNTAFFKNETSEYVNEEGQVKIDDSFKVLGSDSLFAIGDITDIKEIKLGAITKMHAQITANNLNLIINNSGKLKKYKPMGAMGFITLGLKKGIAQLPFMRMDPMVAMKQKDMFVSMFLK